MFQKFIRFFNNQQRNNQRILRHMDGLISKINALEDTYRALSDEALAEKTAEFKILYAEGTPLDALLIPAFATVREASRRILGMRPFDVQLYGGVALHKGMIAEMKTGEGKTLVATLPVYLNALAGQGVHVVTVNDYLAQRDSETMRPLYEFLGLSVGCIIQDLSHSQRHQAYHCDITYGTNNEFGFDYLKDNMKFSPDEMCQRGFAYAIVDEVDSILIDEARTPLIISGPAEGASHLYDTVNDIITHLKPEHYELEEKTKSVAFTDQGYIEVEKLTKDAGMVSGTDLFQPANLMLVHHLNQSLKAHKTFQKDVDYIVKDGKVVLIDEFTGRMMKGRRYSDGLHQAIEAKEHVNIEVENQTLASITFQNYFRMYKKLAGMTGTAETEAVEFQDIYRLPVLSIPTNVPVARKDLEDEIFRTFDQKLHVVLKQIKECHDRNQPVLVGTLSIEKSEVFARALYALDIPFNVLNARHHEQEARIIAQAGSPGAITIATNMAGRGTDIKLGGNLDVMLSQGLSEIEDQDDQEACEHVAQAIRAKHKEQEEIVRTAGGLFVLGTERNENRRIDNQLRGRSGRQGDPGASKFFISLEDDLMRIFGPNLKMLDYSLRKTEQTDTDPIAHPWLTRSIEKAQQKVEAQHFDTRKHLLKYADVLNAQRTAVYDERHFLINATDVHQRVLEIAQSVITDMVSLALDSRKSPEQWDWVHLGEELSRMFNISIDFKADFTDEDRATPERAMTKIIQIVMEKQDSLEQKWGLDMRTRMEKSLLLKTLDQSWIAHLNAMDHLRSGIHLQAYGQKDPLNEYRHEAFVMFKAMKAQWYTSFLAAYFHANPDYIGQYEEEDEDIEALLKKWSYQHASLDEQDSHEAQDLMLQNEVNPSTEPEGTINYRELLEQLLTHDRSLDFDAFDEDDLDALWGNDSASKKKASKSTRGTKKTPPVQGAQKKGAASGRTKEDGTTGSRTAGSRAAGSRTEGAGLRTTGSRTEGTGSRTTTGSSSSSSRSSSGASSRSSSGASLEQNPRTSRSTDRVLTSRAASSRSRAMGNNAAPAGFRSGGDMDNGKSGSGAGSAKYGNAMFQRRAPSKRGPYVPKNNTDFDALPDGLGRKSLGQRGDPSARWQSPGSASGRPGSTNRPGSASGRPGYSAFPRAARALGVNNNPEARREKTGGGARRAMASRDPNALSEQFYASRAPTGGGRSFARSPLGRQKAAQEEALTKELAKELSRNSRAPGSTPFGKKARADSKFALSSRRAVGRGPANRGVRKEAEVYESEQYTSNKRERMNARTGPNRTLAGQRPPALEGNMDARGNRSQFLGAKSSGKPFGTASGTPSGTPFGTPSGKKPVAYGEKRAPRRTTESRPGARPGARGGDTFSGGTPERKRTDRPLERGSAERGTPERKRTERPIKPGAKKAGRTPDSGKKPGPKGF